MFINFKHKSELQKEEKEFVRDIHLLRMEARLLVLEMGLSESVTNRLIANMNLSDCRPTYDALMSEIDYV